MIKATGIFGGGGAVTPEYPHNISNQAITSIDAIASLTWRDPVAEDWTGTYIVYRQDRFPVDENDGALAAHVTQRSRYSVDPLEITGLAEGNFFVKAFPHSAEAVNHNSANNFPQHIITFIYPSALTAFSLAAGNGQLTPTFTLPTNATSCRLVYKIGSYPSDTDDGTVIDPAISGIPVTSLENGTMYYFRAFPRNLFGRLNIDTAGNQASATPTSAFIFSFTGDKSAIENVIYDGISYKQVRLLTSGNFRQLTPWDIDVFVAGAGAGAGYSGAGSGYTKTFLKLQLPINEDAPVMIGTGGIGQRQAALPTPGGYTQILNSNYRALGGVSGAITIGYPATGGDGGSGGGGFPNAAGGTDGNDGISGTSQLGGKGQRSRGLGTTTKAFEATNGKLYATGGKGGASTGSASGANAESNTGDGGNGSGMDGWIGGNGGSGIVIIRWREAV